MALQNATVAITALLAAIPDNGYGNGDTYANTSVPSTAHVSVHLKWPMKDDDAAVTFIEHICEYASVNLNAADQRAVVAKCDIETAVIVAIARCAAAKFHNWERAAFNPPEINTIAANAVAKTIHADHADAVAAALNMFAPSAARYMGIFYYNAISYETANHHHLPGVTKKLASTTITLSGLKDWMVADPARESAVFHDMFHPVSSSVKSAAARDIKAQNHLSGLKFDNLRKRIPVKAPDSGIALNYVVLLRKSRAYEHIPKDLPAALDAPEALSNATNEYLNAATAIALTAAVTRLRNMSAALEEPSAYIAGFILGKEAAAFGDQDLDLKTAKRTCTILGSPAYKRAAGEFSGTFAAGKARGYKRVSAGAADVVIPRCAVSVTSVATL